MLGPDGPPHLDHHHHYYHYHHYQSSHQARAAEHNWVEALGLRELYEGPVLGLLTSADDAGVRPPGLEEAEPEQRAGQDEHDGVERGHEHLEVKQSKGDQSLQVTSHLDVGEPGVIHPELGREVDSEGEEVHESLVEGEHRGSVDKDVEEREEPELDL